MAASKGKMTAVCLAVGLAALRDVAKVELMAVNLAAHWAAMKAGPKVDVWVFP